MFENLAVCINLLGMPKQANTNADDVAKIIEQFESARTLTDESFANERKYILELASKVQAMNIVLERGSKALLQNYQNLEAFEKRVRAFGTGPDGIALDEAIFLISSEIRKITSESASKIDTFIQTAYSKKDSIDLEAINAAKAVKLSMFKVQRYFDDAAKLMNQIRTPSYHESSNQISESDLAFMRGLGDKFFSSLG